MASFLKAFILNSRACISALCIVFYVLLVFSNFTNNEFEEQFNSGVLLASEYEDFDGDGKFDLDQEDDEDGRTSSVKYFSGEALWVFYNLNLGVLKKSYSLAQSQWTPQSVIFDIFQPPKA